MTNKSHRPATKALVAQEIVGRNRFPKLRRLLPLVQIIAHAMPVAERLAISRRILLPIKALRLLEQEERVAVGRAARRRSRPDVVGDKGLAGGQAVGGTGLKAGLDPVEDGTQSAEGGEGRVEVESYDHIGCGGIGDGVGDRGGGLSFWRWLVGGLVGWWGLGGRLTGAGDVLFCCDCLAVDGDAQHHGGIRLHGAENTLDDCVGWHSGRA